MDRDGLADSEEEVIIEDLSIDELVLKVDEGTGKAPTVGGFILLGFPQTDLHVTKLKEHGIQFDRILNLADTSEEDAGQEVRDRMKTVSQYYDWEAEVARAGKVIEMAKELINEEIVSDIEATGSIDQVFVKIRNDIDPFYLRVDNPDDVRVTADLDEEAKRLPKGDFGDYCPTTYVNDGFLIKGNPELELTVHGKTYVFAGEKEMEDFRTDPAKFLIAQAGKSTLPLPPPPPKVMILGMKGAGITTQVQKLCDKYKLSQFDLKNEFMARMKKEKESRKRRRLLDRGFRAPPPDQDPEDPWVDDEIEQDPDDFDRE